MFVCNNLYFKRTHLFQYDQYFEKEGGGGGLSNKDFTFRFW